MKITAFALTILIPAGVFAQANRPNKIIGASDCTAEKLGTSIPVSSIGLPVSAVSLNAPEWRPEANGSPAYCSIEGSMAPVDKSPSAKPIRFGVALPASWSMRAAQVGGGGNNGVIPQLSGGPSRGGMSFLAHGFATYGSDSGHQAGARPWSGTPGRTSANRCSNFLADSRLQRLGAQRRSHRKSRLHADEEDARRRDGADRADRTASGRASITSSARRRAAARRSPLRSAIPPITTASPPTCRS